MTESVPAAASIEQLRKRAKDLRRSTPSLKLTEAQHLVAREHGFPSWPKLKSYVDRLERFGPGLRHAYQQNSSYYAERAAGLLASAADGTPEALAAFEKVGVPVSLRGARTVVANQHGFADWAALRRHIGALAESGEPFVRAYQAIEAQDPTALVAALRAIWACRGSRGSCSTRARAGPSPHAETAALPWSPPCSGGIRRRRRRSLLPVCRH